MDVVRPAVQEQRGRSISRAYLCIADAEAWPASICWSLPSSDMLIATIGMLRAPRSA